jgi:two-component system, OmpR family, sensor histidine kinase VicK
LTNLGSSNAQEITEVLYDQEDIVKWTVQTFTDLKYRSDICADENGPSLFLIPDHPVTKVFGKLKERGVEVRFITEITSKNLFYCKELMKIADLHHMDEIKGNFGIADGKIYGANALSFESQVPPRLITSNMTTFVDQQQYFFNMLWKKSIPAIDRIRELEEGIQRQIIETILDPAESLMLGLELLRSAKVEILIIFSSANAFFRQWKEGLLELLVELSKKEIDIKILTPLDERIEVIKQKFEKQEEYQQRQQKIYIRSLEQPLQVKMSTLLVDRKYSLTIELKDDSKDNSYNAMGLSTYSNSKSTVLSYVSIFQALWMQTSLYEEVKASERIRKDFINIAAHELRNPIQPILGLSDILRYKINDSEQLEILEVINRNAKRLQRLTEDILDVTRIESQSLLLRIERFNIIDVIQNVVADSTKSVGNRKLKVDLLGSKDPIFIEADKGRITQVVTNILNNAIRFISDIGGEIRISIEMKDSKEVLLQVKDTGKGIDLEILPKLFSKFATKSIGGSGLGLYISKSIVEAHRGRIWAYNNSEGKGATFSITLPITH